MLTELMADHILALRELRQALDEDLCPATKDRALQAEARAMTALCNYVPETEEDASRRAAYLLQSRPCGMFSENREAVEEDGPA